MTHDRIELLSPKDLDELDEPSWLIDGVLPLRARVRR